jgi:hypothetical protein
MRFSFYPNKSFSWTWWYSETARTVIHACKGHDLGELVLGEMLAGPICPCCKLSVPDFIQLAAHLNASAYSA